jgi:hypothetical protein
MDNITQKGNILQLRPAQRQKAKLRIGLSGPSGSGKTYSALLLASGISSWEKIVIIDTENGSGELYSHLGPYNVITLQAPFSPEHYIEAIEAAEQSGMEVIILDSVTHEWDGKGGCLEINERLASSKFKGNSWAAWSATTPRHQAFIQRITSSKAHIITTVRSKTDTIQTEDKKIKKVGMKEIQREGFEYELTVNFNLDRDGNLANASKDRTSLFSNEDPFVISVETGKTLFNWANSGIDPVAEAIKVINHLLDKKAKTADGMLFHFGVNSLNDLSVTQLNQAIAKLEQFPDVEKKQPAVDAKKVADEVDKNLNI